MYLGPEDPDEDGDESFEPVIPGDNDEDSPEEDGESGA